MEYRESKECKQRTSISFRQAVNRMMGAPVRRLTKHITWRDAFIRFIDEFYPEFRTEIYQENEDYAIYSQFGNYMSEKYKVSSYWYILQPQVEKYINSLLREMDDAKN